MRTLSLALAVAVSLAGGCAQAGAGGDVDLAAPRASAPPHLVAEVDAAVAEAMASGSPGMAVAVAVGDRVLLAKGYGVADLEHGTPVTTETVFQIASLTKQFTAAAVLLLVEQGKVSLDDKLSRWAPEVPQAHRVTVRQALVQTSGIADYAEDPAGDRLKSVHKTPAEMATWIAGLQPAFLFEPGSSWGYSNSNYALIGLVIERASGETLVDFFRERLFAPAGMTQTAFDDPADVVRNRARGYRKSRTAPGGYRNAEWISPSVPGPAGGLRSTIGDLLRWHLALHGGRILQPQTLELMMIPGRMTDGRPTRAAMPVPMQKAWGSDYAMGVLVGSPDGTPRVWHAGDMPGFATWAAWYPREKVTVVILQNSQSADRHEAGIETAALGAARAMAAGK